MSVHRTYQVLGETLPWLVDRLDKASHGEIRLEVYEPGRLAAGNAVYRTVRSGSVEAGFSSMGFEADAVPASILFGGPPFGMTPWDFLSWYYSAGGRALLEESFADEPVIPILCGMAGPETGGWYRAEVTSADQFRHLRIRAVGTAAEVLRKIGVNVVSLPTVDVQRALETKAIDGAEVSLPSVDEEIGLNKAVRYAYFPGWHQPYVAFYLYVSRAAWGHLSLEQRSLIETGCVAAVTYSLTKAEAAQSETIGRLKTGGTHLLRLPDAVLRELKHASDQILLEKANNNAQFKKVLDAQRVFEANSRERETLDNLPRDGR